MTDTDANSDSPTMSPDDLAGHVQRLRSAADLTQSELADQVGYSASTISKAENYRDGDGMIGVRITIIEELTDVSIEGPLYRKHVEVDVREST